MRLPSPNTPIGSPVDTPEASAQHAVDASWVDRNAFPFTSRWLSTTDGRLHYVDEGRGPAIVFVHGTPTWSFEYRHLIRAMRDSHRCIALDHLGFGLSDRPADAVYTPEAQAARFTEAMTRLGVDACTLVVHDFGGPIALPFALAQPSPVRRLVVLNSWMWPFDDDPAMRRKARVAGGLLGRWSYRYANASLRLIMPSAYGDRRRLTPAIHAQYLRPFGSRDARVQVLWALAHALLASRDHYAMLESQAGALRDRPALVVWGARDTAFGRPQLDRWRRLLPHAQVVEVAEAGHWPHEEAPQVVAAALQAFLSSESSGASGPFPLHAHG